MNTEQPIDEPENEIRNGNYQQALAWWEKKRLMFNMAVVGAQLLMLVSFWQQVYFFGGPESAIIQSVAYTLAANLFYCLGWGSEFLLMYYFKIQPFNSAFRWAIFIGGVGLSVLVTIGLYTLGLDVLFM